MNDELSENQEALAGALVTPEEQQQRDMDQFDQGDFGEVSRTIMIPNAGDLPTQGYRPGHYLVGPGDVELPTLKCVVLDWKRDRVLRLGESRKTICVAEEREAKRWFGVAQQPEDDRELIELKKLGIANPSGCAACKRAQDYPGAPYEGAYKDCCTWRWTFAIHIFGGWPEGEAHFIPPFSLIKMRRMSGKFAAQGILRKLFTLRAAGKQYWDEAFEFTHQIKEAGPNKYPQSVAKSLGATPPEVLEVLAGIALDQVRGETTRAIGPRDISEKTGSDDDLPY